MTENHVLPFTTKFQYAEVPRSLFYNLVFTTIYMELEAVIPFSTAWTHWLMFHYFLQINGLKHIWTISILSTFSLQLKVLFPYHFLWLAHFQKCFFLFHILDTIEIVTVLLCNWYSTSLSTMEIFTVSVVIINMKNKLFRKSWPA